MGPYDYAIFAGLALFMALGLRSGFVLATLLAIGLLGVVLVAFSVGTPQVLLALLAGWCAMTAVLFVLRRRPGWIPRTIQSRAVGGFLGLGQFAVVAVLATGSLAMQMPERFETFRTSTTYPFVAGLAAQVIDADTAKFAIPAVMLSFPEPMELKPQTELVNVNPTVRPIDWAEVSAFDNRIIRILTGNTVAADKAPIAFEANGTILRVHAELGEAFSAGDVLAELDPTPLEIALDERRAALIEAEAVAREANLTLLRQRQLVQSGVVSQAVLDSAEASAGAAQSRLAMTKANIRSAEDRLADTVLYAPFDGVVANRMAEPAQSVQAGVPVFEVQDSNAGFQIEIIVPETLIGRIEAGAEYQAIVLDGNDSPVNARVQEIGSRANATTGFPVTLKVLTDTAPIRAGVTVEVYLSLPLSDANERHVGLAAVPYTAVLPADGAGHISFVYNTQTGTLERRPITVAAREGATALISEGLAPGEIVATRGLPFLRDSQPVALRGVGIARYDS